MEKKNNPLKDWMNEGSGGSYIKIYAGDKFEGVFVSMDFDPTGGFNNKPTIKYRLKDLLDDGKEKTFSSSSKALARKMSTLKVEDRIAIVAREEGGRKKYDVILLDKKENEEEEEDGDVAPEIPF